MQMEISSKAVRLVCVLLLAAVCAMAQTVSATLLGTVLDPAGSVVPGGSLTARTGTEAARIVNG